MIRNVCTIIALITLLASSTPACAAVQKTMTMYFFWGSGCPHCAEIEPFMSKLETKYPQLDMKRFEVQNNIENANLFEAVANAYGKNASIMPTIFIDDQMIEGYNGGITEGRIESAVINCTTKTCISPAQKLSDYKSGKAATTTSSSTTTTTTTTTTTFANLISTTTTTKRTTTTLDPPTTSTTFASAAPGKATLYFFWGQGCPHCEEMKPFIAQIQNANPQITVKSREVFQDQTNAGLFAAMGDAYGKAESGVPTVFIGDKMIVGYVKGTSDKNVTDEINVCLNAGCPDPDQILADYVKVHPTTTMATTTTLPQNGQTGGMDTAILIIGVAVVVLIVIVVVYAGRKKPKDPFASKAEALKA